MYSPKHFQENDVEKTHWLIRNYPFASLISVHDGAPFVNHLPMILSEDGKELIGHMATRNPQASMLPDGGAVTAVFHGPHTYVTPKWYAENDVPTWNYAVTHLSGKIQWVREHSELIDLLKTLTATFEGPGEDTWKFFVPDDLQAENLTRAIVGFKIEIASTQTKFKLSQNRSEIDRQGVIRGLGTRQDEMSLRVRDLMLLGIT